MTLAHVPSWNEQMMVTKSVGQLILSRISQRAVLSTESNAFVRSTKIVLLLPTLLLQLSGSKDHIHGAAACAEAILTLG